MKESEAVAPPFSSPETLDLICNEETTGSGDENVVHKVAKIYIRLYGEGTNLSLTMQASVKFGDFPELSSLISIKSCPNLASVLMFRSPFYRVDGFSPTGPSRKFKKPVRVAISICNCVHLDN